MTNFIPEHLFVSIFRKNIIHEKLVFCLHNHITKRFLYIIEFLREIKNKMAVPLIAPHYEKWGVQCDNPCGTVGQLALHLNLRNYNRIYQSSKCMALRN